MLSELDGDQAIGETGRIDRGIEFGQYVRQCPGVVLMSMSHQNGTHPLAILCQESDVWNDEVYTGHTFIGEKDTCVYYDDVIP